jgi:hypothetical protein
MTKSNRSAVRATLTVALLFNVSAILAQKDEQKEHAELAQALKGAKVSLESGLAASQREGTPISGKFEVENGKLQLSVYTLKTGKFSEVIVDHTTGSITKADPITESGDLTAASTQRDALAKAKLSLHAATLKAVKANKGFRAVSVIPSLKEGHPIAEITLVSNSTFKTVTGKLD